jgi:hypothetical protein
VAAVGDPGAELGLQALGLTLSLDLPGDLTPAAGDQVDTRVDDADLE